MGMFVMKALELFYIRTLHDMMNDKKMKITRGYSLSVYQCIPEEKLFLILLAGVSFFFFTPSLFSVAIISTTFAGIFYMSQQQVFAPAFQTIRPLNTPRETTPPYPQDPAPTDELTCFKKQMINMLIHDLKTPLSNIISLSENGQSGSDMERIYESGTHMLDLIMNILDVEKMEEVKLPINPEPLHSSTLIDKAIAQVEGKAQAKNIIIQSPPHPTSVAADSRLVKRTLTNLLSNAIKYSPQNSKILVETQQVNADTVRFSVSDQGCGIPQKAQKNVFDKFYQVNHSPKISGAYSTGIGLTFCKLAVEAQGGTIGVQSQVGKGTTFWFTLPAGKLSQPNNTSVLRKTPAACAPCSNYFTSQDKDLLTPWLIQLRQYEVYQLSKIKGILKTMTFEQESIYNRWKKQLEQALYTSNQEQYEWLIK